MPLSVTSVWDPSATWYWGLCGYVCIDSGGRLTGAGDKTQICHSLCGPANKAPAMIRTKKDALADAYANNGAVPARLGPVGSSSYTPQGTAHDWLYTSLEDAALGPVKWTSAADLCASAR